MAHNVQLGNVKHIALTEDEFKQLTEDIKGSSRTIDGYVYPDDKSKASGYIVQSNLISYTDINGNITVYYVGGRV